MLGSEGSEGSDLGTYQEEFIGSINRDSTQTSPWVGRHLSSFRSAEGELEGKGRRNGTFPRINGRHPGCRAAGTTEKIVPQPEGRFVHQSVVYILMKVVLCLLQSLGVERQSDER